MVEVPWQREALRSSHQLGGRSCLTGRFSFSGSDGALAMNAMKPAEILGLLVDIYG
jgi:hypothetical protein